MCRSVRGGTLAVSRSSVEGVMRCAGAYGRPWRVHARPPLPRSMQAPVRWLHCASCVLHRPGGVLLRQNPTASEISDARFRAIYSGMRKLPPCIKCSITDCPVAGPREAQRAEEGDGPEAEARRAESSTGRQAVR